MELRTTEVDEIFSVGAEPLDSDAMAKEFSMEFSNMVFTRGQELAFRYRQKDKPYTLKLMVKSLEGSIPNSDVAEVCGRSNEKPQHSKLTNCNA